LPIVFGSIFKKKFLSKMNQLNNNIGSQTPQNVVILATESIKSTANTGIYSRPENYDLIKENIEIMGLITPLIVDANSNEIISGNIRHQIAIELGIQEVPVIFQEVNEDDKKAIILSTNVFKQKSSLEILREIEYFDEYFKVKKGMRTDLVPELKELKSKRDKSLKGISKDKQNKLKAINKMAKELYGEESEEYKAIFNCLDNGSSSLFSVFKELNSKLKLDKNNLIIPKTYDFLSTNASIFCKSSKDLSEISDNSVQTICMSPPYFGMRDYFTGNNQLGLEKDGDTFIDNLGGFFKEIDRVLKPEGSLFVNLNDCCIGGIYQAIPQKFVLKMIELGFIFVDEFVWVKKNPVYTSGNRSVRNHEPIFHFVKSNNYYYDLSWMEELIDENNAISYGTNARYPKLFSGLDYVINGVIRGNASTTAELRKECSKQGFHLTHSATFPLSVPSICILTTSKPGDIVLDCFNGTGTTGEAAIALGRKYYGYETNTEYVMASEVRLKPYLNEEKEEEYLIAA
jgi:DNA modification methylase